MSSLQSRRRRLGGSVHEDEAFEGLDLRAAIAVSSVFRNCSFKECKFNGAALDNATFENCTFSDCSLEMCRMICRLYGCEFYRCNLDQSIFTGADIRNTRFKDCRLEYAIFDRASVINGAFLHCQLHGARLDFAATEDVDFTGSNLWGAVIPINCAMFSGSTFDKRQIGLLLAMLMRSRHPEDRLAGIIDPIYRKMVDRLVSREN